MPAAAFNACAANAISSERSPNRGGSAVYRAADSEWAPPSSRLLVSVAIERFVRGGTLLASGHPHTHSHPRAQCLILSAAAAMSRGNQRDVDRARAQARAAKTGTKKGDGLTPAQRNERCVVRLHGVVVGASRVQGAVAGCCWGTGRPKGMHSRGGVEGKEARLAATQTWCQPGVHAPSRRSGGARGDRGLVQQGWWCLPACVGVFGGGVTVQVL